MISRSIKPRKIIPILISISGFIAIALPVYKSIGIKLEPKKYIEVPGNLDVKLKGPATYTIYHQIKALKAIDDKWGLDDYHRLSKSKLSDLKCELTFNGNAVSLENQIDNLSKSKYGQLISVGAFEFNTEKDGVHKINCWYEPDVKETKATLLVERGSRYKFLVYFLAIIYLVIAQIIAGILYVIMAPSQSDKKKFS